MATSDSVYFASDGQLFRVPRAGGASTRLRDYPPSSSEDFSVARPAWLGGELYQRAVAPGRQQLIARVPLDGGPWTTALAAAGGKLYRLESDGGVLAQTASTENYVAYRGTLYRFRHMNTVPPLVNYCRVELDGGCNEILLATSS